MTIIEWDIDSANRRQLMEYTTPPRLPANWILHRGKPTPISVRALSRTHRVIVIVPAASQGSRCGGEG